MGTFLSIVGGLVLFRFVYSLTIGQLRSRKLARRYGLAWQFITDDFARFVTQCRSLGAVATVRAYEISLRLTLEKESPDVRYIAPLYCQGMDPINETGEYKTAP